jgi:hypothetical protein
LRKDELTTAENDKAGLAAGECGNGYRSSGNGYRHGPRYGNLIYKLYPHAHFGFWRCDPIAPPFPLALNRDLTDFDFGKAIVCGRLPIFKTPHADGARRPGALVAFTGLRMCARS